MAEVKKTDTTPDWDAYLQGIDYNNRLSPNYYSTVNRNWRAYNLQLYDAITTALPKVNMPMSQRIVRQSVATCMTKSVKLNYVVENVDDNTTDPTEQMQRTAAAWLMQNSKDKWERLKMDDTIRTLLLNGANEGDYATHTYWDATYDTGQTYGEELVTDKDGNPVLDEMGMPTYQPVKVLGEYYTEVVDGANVFFGNPNDRRVNFNGRAHQPYILIAGREIVSKLRKEAKANSKENGLDEDDIKEKIVSDLEYNEQVGDRGKNELENRDSDYGKATYIIKYWFDEDTETIHFNKSVKGCYIRKDVDTELTLYPVAWGNWDIIKNSYHGQALMTGLISNQMELDRAWASVFLYLKNLALPKAIYNKAYLPNGPSNKINDAIGYDGGDNVKPSDILSYTQPGQMANRLLDVITLFQTKTMELLGASDAFLGNANPENTSALFAMAENSAVPLESVKAGLYQFIEDLAYIWNDFRLHKYKTPRKIAIEVDGVRQVVLFDPSTLSDAKLRISVDVIPGSYMDEFSIVRTMENLFDRQIVDAVDMIERIPGQVIPEKEKLLAKVKQRQAQMEMMQSQQFKLQAIQEFVQSAQGQPDPTQQPVTR